MIDYLFNKTMNYGHFELQFYISQNQGMASIPIS